MGYSQSPNHREALTGISSITGENEYVYSTNNALDVNAILSVPGELDVNLTEVGGSAIALGQTTMAASIPVAIASNQTAMPVSQSGTWNINNISGTISLPTGATTEATLLNISGTTTTVDGLDTSRLLAVGGSDGTNMRLLAVNSAGELQIGAAQSGTWNINNVSGTISLPSGASTATNQTDGSQKTQIVDAGGEAVTVTGGKLDVNATISGSGGGTSSIDDSAFSIGSDSGTPAMGLFDDTGTDSVDENDVGVVRMSGNRNLYTQIRDAAGNERGVNVTAGNALTVDGSASTQPVSNAGLTELAAAINSNKVDTNLVSTDLDLMLGTDYSSVMGTSSLIQATQADDVANTTDSQFVTNFNMVYDGTTWDRARGDATDGMLVNLGSNNDVTVTGSVTANAGTNLNTSALALESGGNLAAIAASASVLDDWDETNRAAVNTISGQVGVQGNSGAVSANTQRVVLATDVALPAGTNAIGKLAANSGVDIGDVDVTSAVSGTLDHGSNRDIDTSAEQITSTSFSAKFGVTLTADSTNTGIIYIGNSDVTAGTTAATDGIPLLAGQSITLPITNSNIPYAIASANNQVIYWIAV